MIRLTTSSEPIGSLNYKSHQNYFLGILSHQGHISKVDGKVLTSVTHRHVFSQEYTNTKYFKDPTEHMLYGNFPNEVQNLSLRKKSVI